MRCDCGVSGDRLKSRGMTITGRAGSTRAKLVGGGARGTTVPYGEKEGSRRGYYARL